MNNNGLNFMGYTIGLSILIPSIIALLLIILCCCGGFFLVGVGASVDPTPTISVSPY